MYRTKKRQDTNLFLAWNRKQQELRKQFLHDNEIANVAVNRRIMKDLDRLKIMCGLLTSAAEVEKYMSATHMDEGTKVERLYMEVRYARDTSLSLPKTRDLFRLMKDYRKLPVETYDNFVVNLKIYLNNITSNAAVTLDDFIQAMGVILSQGKQ